MAFYFAPILDELHCYKLADIKDMARSQDLKEVEIIKAERDTGQGYFFCKHFATAGDVIDSGCGSNCEAYKPRNGKNGRCIHSGYCYSQTNEKRTIKL